MQSSRRRFTFTSLDWSTIAGSHPTTGSISMITGIERARVRALAFALTFVMSPWLALDARAASEAQSERTWSVEQLMLRLAQVKSAKAKFTERKHLRMLNAPLEF